MKNKECYHRKRDNIFILTNRIVKFKENNIKSKMILQVHDELIFDTLKEEKEKVCEIIESVMDADYNINVPLEIDIESGEDWYQAK